MFYTPKMGATATKEDDTMKDEATTKQEFMIPLLFYVQRIQRYSPLSFFSHYCAKLALSLD